MWMIGKGEWKRSIEEKLVQLKQLLLLLVIPEAELGSLVIEYSLQSSQSIIFLFSPLQSRLYNTALILHGFGLLGQLHLAFSISSSLLFVGLFGSFLVGSGAGEVGECVVVADDPGFDVCLDVLAVECSFDLLLHQLEILLDLALVFSHIFRTLISACDVSTLVTFFLAAAHLALVVAFWDKEWSVVVWGVGGSVGLKGLVVVDIFGLWTNWCNGLALIILIYILIFLLLHIGSWVTVGSVYFFSDLIAVTLFFLLLVYLWKHLEWIPHLANFGFFLHLSAILPYHPLFFLSA